MLSTTGKPLVVPADAGRRGVVLGIDITVKLPRSETGGDFYIFETLTPPGLGIPPHVHKREDEILQVFDGELEIFLDGKSQIVKPGALINFPRLIPHGFRNVGKKPARALFTVIPGQNFEKFFEELLALPADPPPDRTKVAEIFARYDIEILAPGSA